MPRIGALLIGLSLLVVLIASSLGFLGRLALPVWGSLTVAWGVGLWAGLAISGERTPMRAAREANTGNSVSTNNKALDPVDPASHELETVEGIGGGYGRRLRDLGVTDTLALVQRGSRADARDELAGVLKVEPLVVQRWTSMADLLRVPGMDGQSAEVLEAAGVPTVSALAKRSGPELVGVLLEVNERLRLTPDELPGVEQIQNWVGLASFLPGIVEDL